MPTSQPQQAGTDTESTDYKAQLDAAAGQAKPPGPNQNQDQNKNQNISGDGVGGAIVDKGG